MQRVEDGQRGKQGGRGRSKISFHESAVHVCIVTHVRSLLMNIVFRL